MKESILKKAGEIFLKYGFKSVTMDDIAKEMAMSKKTIYKYFKNKACLVDASTLYVHNEVHNIVSTICEMNYNAIHENFEVKNMFKDMFKNSNKSPMFQLKKYYPKTFNKIMESEFEMFKDCIHNNIDKGVREGLYRKDLDKKLIAKFYFALAIGVHNDSTYINNEYTLNDLEINVLEYHTRAIATEKGIKELENQLQKLNSNR